MKFLASVVALLGVISLMIGIILVQSNYQNSWREAAISASTASSNSGPTAKAQLDQRYYAAR
jgi:hypothetical protein